MKVEHNRLLSYSAEEFTFKTVSSGNAFCGSEWYSTEPAPPYSRLYYMVEGEGQISGEDGIIPLCAGKLYMIPAGYSFSYSCPDSMHQLYFHVNMMSSSGADLLRGLGRVFSMNVEKEHIDRLLSLHGSDSMTDRLYLKTLLQQDILTLLKASGTELKSIEYSDCVKKALLFIEEHLSATLTVSAVAENIFVSPDTLAHKFKKEMDISVGRHIDGLLMSRAEDMLLNTRLTVAQISSNLGFYDQFYFSRRFKERFSVSPVKYRKTRQSAK